MKHRVVGRRLDRTTEHRTAMLRNMVTSLIRHERIQTTTPKAKELKRFADKVITLAKKGSPHARRLAHREVRDVEALNKLFDTLAGRYEKRPGGYTRVIRIGRRAGDAAEMSVIELVDRAPAPEASEPPKGKAEKAEKAPKKVEKAEKKAEKAPKKAEKAEKKAPAKKAKKGE